jgi:26S proteasome non-ATPase regulatory subunit 5
MPDGEQDLIQLENNFEKHFKRILPHMIRQVPISSVSYTDLLTQLVSSITTKLNSIQERISSKELEVEVFSSSVFDNNKSLIDEFENVAKVSSIQAFRVLEVFIRLGALSKNHLHSICEEKFHLSTKIQDLLNEKYDILSLINCIELLNILASTLHGLHYLENNGFLTHLVNSLKSQDPMTFILVPSIVKLFSHVAREQPEYVYETYRFYYQFLFDKLKDEQNDQSMFNLAIETFSFLFEYNLLKKFFDEKFNQELEYVLEKLILTLKNSINDQLRVSTLICVANLISTDPALLQTHDTDEKWLRSPWNSSEWHELAQTFYTRLTSKLSHENVFQICLNLAKKPFPELRLAAQLYFKALAQTKWGINALFTPNKYNSFEDFFIGYLTNRSIEQEKLGLESKYELIKLLVANMNFNTNLIHLIGEEGLARLNLYIREGPFFAKAESRVAFEGE